MKQLNIIKTVALVVGLGALILSTSITQAAPGRQSPYTVLENSMVFPDPGTWFAGMDGQLYIRGMVMTAEDASKEDERVTGTVTLKFDMIWKPPFLTGPIWCYVKLVNHHDDPAKNGWWEGACSGGRELMAD